MVSLLLALNSPWIPFLSRARPRHVGLKAFQDLTSLLLPASLPTAPHTYLLLSPGGPQFWFHIKSMGASQVIQPNDSLSGALTSPTCNYCWILLSFLSSPPPIFFLNPSYPSGLLVHCKRGLYYKSRELGRIYLIIISSS